MRYAVGDVHGHRREVRRALAARGLIDERAHWSGGDAEVWFAGDLMDRGPDGAGVVEDVMRWQRQAVETGGAVGCVLGNHEALALGFRRFGRDELGIDPFTNPHNFVLSWLMNGGQMSDQERLTDEMAAWMADLPAVARCGDDLIVHADTVQYLRWGADVDTINSAVRRALNADEKQAAWEVWAAMTTRYDYLGDDGPERARAVLDTLGGSRIVHGHSIIGDLTDTEPSQVTKAWSYADGLVLAVDGGIYAGGPSLVVPLDKPC